MKSFGGVPSERPSMKELYRRACLSDLNLLLALESFDSSFRFAWLNDNLVGV